MVGQNLEVILASSGFTLSSQEHCHSFTIQRYLKWFIFITFYCQIKKMFRLSKERSYVCMYVLKYS